MMAGSKEKIQYKVAITRQNFMSQFIELDQTKPLAAIIEYICERWRLAHPDNYALRFNDKDKKEVVTERNRNEIRDGVILELFDSPVKAAQNILEDIDKGTDAKKTEALRQLAELSEDNKFAENFVNKKGIPVLMKMVQSGSYDGAKLSNLLSAFCDLMAHGLVPGDVLEEAFITQVVAYVAKPSKVEIRVLQSSLEILENLVTSSSVVENTITPAQLLVHLTSYDLEVRKNTLALINALFRKADDARRQKYAEGLQSQSFRKKILEEVILGKSVGDDMWHQLYVLQSFMFNFLEQDRQRSVNMNDNQADKDLNTLRQAAFEADPDAAATHTTRRRSHVAEYKKLGFEHFNDPLEDFTVVPPGVLALKTMVYFARLHFDDYTKIVLENSCRADDHDLPFAKACISLTELLCDILNIGEPPNDLPGTENRFCPMFFTTDHPFEELFCVCVALVNKTWKEMRATSLDFSKVMSVVREQIVRALNDRHNNYDQFKVKLSKLTYAEITNIWQRTLKDKEEISSQARPIKELRERLKPEIYELVKQQRLNYLVEGTRFPKFSSNRRPKDKYWYCKLTPNHKSLLYYECTEHGEMSPEQTEKKLNVEDFKCVLSGKDCPHVKDNKKTTKGQAPTLPLAFSILTEKEIEVVSEKEFKDSLNFIAPSQEDLLKWVDGLNALLQQRMTSPHAKEEMDMLLNMEIKLRLLDTEGITIPENPPPIPAEPPNYDFYYDT